MAKQSILLVGATGEMGSDILEGLMHDGRFKITCLVRPSSINKSSTQALKDRGLDLVIGDTAGEADALANVLKGHDTVISCITPGSTDQEIRLVDAAAAAGIKRFVPCTFSTVCPPGGVMFLRDEKEKVINRMWSHHLPYTIIECGFWYQGSFFALPSGKLDYAVSFNSKEMFGDGSIKTIVTDKRDVGPVVARIIRDERTVNRFVFIAGAVMSQMEIARLEQRLSGETPALERVSKEQLEQRIESLSAEFADENSLMKKRLLFINQYNYSMHVRGDNTPEFAAYLGYLDARELYPGYKYITFEEFFKELMEGKGKKPYEGRYELAK